MQKLFQDLIQYRFQKDFVKSKETEHSNQICHFQDFY